MTSETTHSNIRHHEKTCVTKRRDGQACRGTQKLQQETPRRHTQAQEMLAHQCRPTTIHEPTTATLNQGAAHASNQDNPHTAQPTMFHQGTRHKQSQQGNHRGRNYNLRGTHTTDIEAPGQLSGDRSHAGAPAHQDLTDTKTNRN